MGSLQTFQEFTSGARPQGGTIRELVLGRVTNVISKKRPLLAFLKGTGEVTNTYVESLTDVLPARAHNAVVEDYTYTAQDSVQPSRHFTHTQSLYASGQVTDTARAVGRYGMSDPYTYQVNKKLQSVLNDLEHTCHRGSAASGETNVPRQFNGLLNIPGATTMTAMSGVTLTEGVFIDLLQAFVDNNYDVDVTRTFVNSWLKRTISEYSTKNTFNIPTDARTQILNIERHNSDFGDVDIVYTQDQLKSATKHGDTNSLVFVDGDHLSLGWLRPLKVEPLARDGTRDRFQISGEVTLVYDTAVAVGGATQVSDYINAT